MSSKSVANAIAIIREQGGTIRTSEALKAGIHPETLYKLRDEGYLITISRGVYRLVEMEKMSNPDFITVATRVPSAVICLISALAFHNITTQIPHVVVIAIPKDKKPPRIKYPPTSIHKFSEDVYCSGIEDHTIDGIQVEIYNAEKTIADCFKYRNKIGLDVCIEALKLYKARKKVNVKKLMHYAEICRVKNIMLPYLESIIG